MFVSRSASIGCICLNIIILQYNVSLIPYKSIRFTYYYLFIYLFNLIRLFIVTI